MMSDALPAGAEVDESSGAVGALEADRARGIDDRELLDSYSRAVVPVVKHVGPTVVSIAVLCQRAAPGTAGVRVRELTSQSRGPRTGRPPPQGAKVAFAHYQLLYSTYFGGTGQETGCNGARLFRHAPVRVAPDASLYLLISSAGRPLRELRHPAARVREVLPGMRASCRRHYRRPAALRRARVLHA
jgi:hypothetical protein